jgi:hypothetical protein
MAGKHANLRLAEPHVMIDQEGTTRNSNKVRSEDAAIPTQAQDLTIVVA